jgi:pantetheine-phosphate adenylyltransferase
MKDGTAVLGGTFDHLHEGHKALLEEAFRSARNVAIGVTTDAYLLLHPKPDGKPIAPFDQRKRRLAAYLRRHYPSTRWRLVPLADRFGRSLEPGIDVLVASDETREGALAVNRARKRRGLPPLTLRLIPLVLAADGLPLSSRRIRTKRLDASGRRRVPLLVVLDAPPALRSSLVAIFRAAFPSTKLSFVSGKLPAPARARSGVRPARLPGGAEYGVRVRGRIEHTVEVTVQRSDGGLWRRGLHSSVGAPALPEGVARELQRLLQRALAPAARSARAKPISAS